MKEGPDLGKKLEKLPRRKILGVNENEAALAILLRNSRRARKLTLKQAAGKLGISENTVKDWEVLSELHIPEADKFPDISDVYGIDLEQLKRVASQVQAIRKGLVEARRAVNKAGTRSSASLYSSEGGSSRGKKTSPKIKPESS